MDPDKLPDHEMPNADPTRKMFSASEVEEDNVQETPEREDGDLAFLRSKGVNRINLR